MEVSTYEKLLQASFHFISYRPRSEKEIRDFLKKKLSRWKTAATATVPKVLERLREYGYLDDTKFAQWWVDQRRSFRPKGTIALTRELGMKGIQRDVIAKLLPKTNNNELFDAQKLIAKKQIQWSKLPKPEQKKKIWQYLRARGFSAQTISRIVDLGADDEL